MISGAGSSTGPHFLMDARHIISRLDYLEQSSLQSKIPEGLVDIQ